MSTFIALLRQHHQALETQYSSQLSNDMRRAIYAMLMCKTAQQHQSLWACDHCEHHDRTPLSCGHRKLPAVPTKYYVTMASETKGKAFAC